MAENEQKQENNNLFPAMVKIEPCTSNECVNGHKWPAQLAIGTCPGCGCQFLAVRMLNCPVCNDPVKKFKMRTDHTLPQFGVAAVCKGQGGQAEVNIVEMLREHASDCMKKWDPETGRMNFGIPAPATMPKEEKVVNSSAS